MVILNNFADKEILKGKTMWKKTFNEKGGEELE